LRPIGEWRADTGDAVVGQDVVELEAGGLGLSALVVEGLVCGRVLVPSDNSERS
jgi:hypothetical protein